MIKIKLSTSTNIFFNRPNGEKADIFDTLDRVSRAGYRKLDFNFHDMANFHTEFTKNNWDKWLKEINLKAQSLNINISQGHSHFFNYSDMDLENREFHIEMLRRSIEGAGILGIKNLVIHSCTDFNSSKIVEDSKKSTIQFLDPYIKLASKYDICICFENLWDLNISPKRRYTVNAEELIDLVDTLSKDNENVGICWDIEHSGLLEQDLQKELKLVGNRLKAIHVSDFTSIKNDHILPFEGHLNWYEVMKILSNVNYKGDFTYEIHRFTMNTPDYLVDDKLKYSVKVGKFLIEVFNNAQKR